MSKRSIRANPLDGVVLLMGCDKTTPSLLMGAASVRPARPSASPAGPMLQLGKWRGQDIGSGTGVWQMTEEVRAGSDEAAKNSSRPKAACTASTATA
jgi:dihydroxy-acid dehydratase